MNRRQFLTNSTAAASSLFVLPLVGCPGADNAINILNIVIDSAVAVLKVAEPNAPWLAAFTNAVGALKQAEASWQGGSPVTIVISALNTLAAVAATIPLTATYSPLIDILVAGIDAVLLALPQAASASLSSQRNVRVGRTALNKPHAFQSHVGAYKEQWDKIVTAEPSLAAAKL